MGLSGSAFSFFNHIVKCHVIAHVVLKYVEKITTICNIGTHENVISDSDEEHIEKTIITLAAGNTNILFY